MKREKKTSPGSAARAAEWSKIYQRLDTARAALERSRTRTREEKAEILKARAKALAQESALEEGASETIEIVEFVLAHERYGLESRFVREVYPLRELTPLPGTPGFVLGIVNVRGQIISVVDLKKFFDLPQKGLTDLDKLIILESGDMTFGILADAVPGARRIALCELQHSLPTLTGIRQEFLKGVTSNHVVILDVERLLSSKDIIVHEEVVGEG